MPRDEEKIPGPIEGLRLPQRAWAMLRRENITTIDRLRAVADRLQRFEGVGFRTARAIREEIARARPRWPG
jgi:DNA-directed RNA polymerase alpha subunit